MDEGCSYPIQQGAKLSRARVYTFRHNDAADLEALLERIEAEERRERCGRTGGWHGGGARVRSLGGGGGGGGGASSGQR
jgi:hypothetical protein